MFRKIVSNLAFSPALVGQLGFYAKRLRKEETTRRLGLIITVMALIVQGFAVFSPPEAANASSGADFIPGGVSNMTQYLKYYDKNYNNIKSILSSLGITRAELQNTKLVTIGEASRYNWSMTSLYSYAQGQRSYSYKGPAGASRTVYYRPMRLTQEGGDKHPVFAGYSATQGWFAIKKDCGNLITAKPPVIPKPAAACTDLAITPITSTKFRFVAKGSTKNGATINNYTYTVHNSTGAVVKTIKVTSKSTSNTYDYTQSKAGKYSVTMTVGTSLGTKSDANCHASFTVVSPAQPLAVCSELDTDISDRTIVGLSGSAAVKNGATVSKYTFVVKDASGVVVKTIDVASNKLTASPDSFTLSTPGTYTVTLAVTSSVGVVTDQTDCVKNITIVPLQVCQYNNQLPPSSPDCQPCPGNQNIWIKDVDCKATIIDTKTATNISQDNVDATKTTARAGDRISYTVSVQNTGTKPTTLTIKESLADVLEYSNLVDGGGGILNNMTKELDWSNVTVAPKTTQSRTFVIKVLDKIPLTNTGTSNATSYDCTMTNTFGNSVDVNVTCPKSKVLVESTVSELPHTGPKENLVFAGIFFAVVAYFYARSRQLGTEVRLIRRDVNAGTI